MQRTVLSPSLYSTWLLSSFGKRMSHPNKICLSGLLSGDPHISHSLEKTPFHWLQEIAQATLVSDPPDKSTLMGGSFSQCGGKRAKAAG